MSYQLTLTQKPVYLHAVITGLNNKANVMRYLEELFRECQARNCFRVLIEERLDGPRIGTADVYQIAAEGSRNALGYFKAIAYVDANAAGNLMHFAEDVAVNRGLPVKVFASTADAENWLLEQANAARAPTAAR